MRLFPVRATPSADNLPWGHDPECSQHHASTGNPAPHAEPERFESMSVVVARKDALQIRNAVLSLPGKLIHRFSPTHQLDKVRFSVRFPAAQRELVSARILGCLPAGRIGVLPERKSARLEGSSNPPISHPAAARGK